MQRSARSEIVPLPLTPSRAPADAVVRRDGRFFLSDQDNADDDLELTPPTAERVAARSLVLALTSCRGFIDADAADASDFWQRVRDWFTTLDINSELEPFERELIDQPLGTLSPQVRVNLAWACEGMAVLAWALSRLAMPPYDQSIVAADVAESIGFLKSRPETVLESPSLQSVEHILEAREQLFAINWRLTEYRLQSRPIEFPTVAQNAWFGPMSLGACRIVDGDLAIGDVRIDKADPARLREAVSIATERHRAANWLVGESQVYSEIDTST